MAQQQRGSSYQYKSQRYQHQYNPYGKNDEQPIIVQRSAIKPHSHGGKNKAANSIERDDEKKLAPVKISNGLAVIIGISKYDILKDLSGVRKDVKNWRNLWKKEYNYDTFPRSKNKKWYGKHRWTTDEIEQCVEEARDLLVTNNKLVYRGLIVIVCGHGLDGVILPSDYNPKPAKPTFKIDIMHSKFGRGFKAIVCTMPRVFIVDCCRGGQAGGAVKVRRGNKLVPVHQDQLLCTLYGNSPGIEVSEDVGGGYFSQCLIEQFKRNAKKQNPRVLSDITILANDKLEELTGSDQILSKEGHAKCDKIVFVPKK